MSADLLSSGGRYDDSMTLEEATEFLRELLEEFPFSDWVEIERADVDGGGKVRQSRSMAVQIAAMLSQFAGACVARGSNRMGFIYNANSQRSGKTLLAKIAIMPLYKSFKAQSWKTKEDDLQKVVDSEVLAGSTYICFDNVRGYVGSQSLEGLMTTPQWTGRVLGETRMFTAENRLTLFVTGNDCMVSPDMNHRCLTCDLFVQEQDVQERSVKNLIDEVWLQDLDNRRKILSALWAIARHWYAAEMPTATSYGFKPRRGFERWGDVIGGMVAFAGFGNCLQSVKLENAGDSEDRNISRLVQKLVDMALGDVHKYKFQDLVNVCYDEDIFLWKLKGRADSDNNFKLDPSANSSFGILMSKYAPAKGRTFRFKPGETILFSHEGEGRDKRFIIEIRRA